MHQQLPLTQWALFRPLRPASGFKSMDPLDVAAQIEADQIEKLKDTFTQCLHDPENAEEYRASAFESCPGLTELWIQPFMAKYDTKAEPVVCSRLCQHRQPPPLSGRPGQLFQQADPEHARLGICRSVRGQGHFRYPGRRPWRI